MDKASPSLIWVKFVSHLNTLKFIFVGSQQLFSQIFSMNKVWWIK